MVLFIESFRNGGQLNIVADCYNFARYRQSHLPLHTRLAYTKKYLHTYMYEMLLFSVDMNVIY